MRASLEIAATRSAFVVLLLPGAIFALAPDAKLATALGAFRFAARLLRLRALRVVTIPSGSKIGSLAPVVTAAAKRLAFPRVTRAARELLLPAALAAGPILDALFLAVVAAIALAKIFALGTLIARAPLAALAAPA